MSDIITNVSKPELDRLDECFGCLVEPRDHAGELRFKWLWVDWEIIENRSKFFQEFLEMIVNWEGQLPDLRKIFADEQMNWLLVESVKCHDSTSKLFDSAVFIDFVIRSGYKDGPYASKYKNRRTTAVHWAAERNYSTIVAELFKIYDRFNVTYTNERGLTHFHAACMSGCLDVVEKFLKFGQNPNLVVEKTGDTPLFLALDKGHKDVARLLLNSGVKPDVANYKNGCTLLHFICGKVNESDHALEMLFEISNELNQSLLIDARDKFGCTPLHVALARGHTKASKLLLRKDANPNLTDNKGLTPLHYICGRDDDDDHLVKILFEVSDEKHRPVEIDARNVKGASPLFLALYRGSKRKVEMLLRRGADPNFVIIGGLTPLHVICLEEKSDDLAKMFLQINDDIQLTVQVDAREKSGWTPLQVAVANLKPNTVDILLDHGADLSKFAFPPEALFTKIFKSHGSGQSGFQLVLVSGVLAVVERLEKRGYHLDSSDASSIVKLFAKYCLSKKSTDLEKSLRSDSEFVEKAQELMMNSSLSLYDFIQLRPKEAAKLFTYSDYFEFARSNKLTNLPKWCIQDCAMYLCKIISRRFSHRWGLEFFLELTHCELPALCCEKIIGLLNVEDLWMMCTAATIVDAESNA